MFLFQSQLLAARRYVLANEKIKITISDAGTLDSVENLLASETYSFRADAFTLDSDLGMFSNSTTHPAGITAGQERIVFANKSAMEHIENFNVDHTLGRLTQDFYFFLYRRCIPFVRHFQDFFFGFADQIVPVKNDSVIGAQKSAGPCIGRR